MELRAPGSSRFSKVMQSLLPVFLLAAGATIPAGVQSLFYLCCFLCFFKISVWSNTARNYLRTTKGCVRLWTALLIFSFIFLNMEIMAQVLVNIKLEAATKMPVTITLRVLGLNNLRAWRLVLALAKHFLVLFVSSWQRGVFLAILEDEDSVSRFNGLLELKKYCIKFAENVAIHFWSLVLLSICLIKITPLNLPYVMYLTAYSVYTGSRPYGGKQRMIKGIKIGYLVYLVLHYMLLLGIHVSAYFSTGAVKLAKDLRLSFICEDESLGITTLYIGDLILSLLFGLFEFSIKKYPDREDADAFHDSLHESLLPNERKDGGAGQEENEEAKTDADAVAVAVAVDPYPFHWCTGFAFCLYALLLGSMVGTYILITGLMILTVPREKIAFCKTLILTSAFYMSCLWLTVYIIVSSSICSRHMEGIGMCDGRTKAINKWFETHLLSILPIFSIVVMKQKRLYYTSRVKPHWIHKAYDRCNGYIQLLLGSVSSVLVPLTWIYLATFCQPHNDMLHSMYIILLMLHLVCKFNIAYASGVLASCHTIVIFLSKRLFYNKNLFNFNCKENSLTAVINSCKLTDEKYNLDMLLLLFLVLSTSLDRNSVEEKREQVVARTLHLIKENLREGYKKAKNAFVHFYGRSLGWYLTLLIIMLIVHLENLKGKKNSLIQVLWTGLCVLNLVCSNLPGCKTAKSVLWSAIPVYAVFHLLCQFLYASFYTYIFKMLPHDPKIASFIEDNVGLTRDATAGHLMISIGEPIFVMLLMQLYKYSAKHKEDSPNFSTFEKFVERLAVVHLDKLLAYTVFLFVVHLNTLLGTLILACFLVSLHMKPFDTVALSLLKVCEILTCLTLVAAEALYVPCISHYADHRIMKLINFICCGNQKAYFVTSWLSLAVLSISKITMQQRSSHSLGEFITSWPSALCVDKKSEETSSEDKEKNVNGEKVEEKKVVEAKKTSKWMKLKKQIWYIEQVIPFHLERVFYHHGSGVCSFIFLLCAFYAKNIISIVYVAFIILSSRNIGKNSWMVISITCSSIALYQDILGILELHGMLSISGISNDWTYWLSLKPTTNLIWTCMIAAFFSCMKFRYVMYEDPSIVEEREESAVSNKFFEHECWSEIEYFNRKSWTIIEFILYGFLRYSQDISLVFVVSLAFYDKDAVHLGYLFLSLYFFRQRDSLRKKKNKLWRILVVFNLTIIFANILYQMPVFKSKMKKNTCNLQNLIGLYKITGLIGNSLHTFSMRPITSILLFLVLQIQTHIFEMRILRTVTKCGLDLREQKQNFLIKLQHQKMLAKKFKVQAAFKDNENRKQRLKWLRNNVLQKEVESVEHLTGGESAEEGKSSECVVDAEEKAVGRRRKISHTRNVSDLPEQIFLDNTYSKVNTTRSSASIEKVPAVDLQAELRRHSMVAEESPEDLVEESVQEVEDKTSGEGGGDEASQEVQEAPEKVQEIEEGSVRKESHDSGEEDAIPHGLSVSFWEKLFMSDRMDSHNFFCYFCMCLFFISEFSLLSMVYPVFIFYYALLVKSPPKKFWKIALATMEFWLLAQYIWQVPIYNSGISPDNISICEWVSEKSELKTVQIVGLHQSATKCFPGFLLYLSCLFHLFSLENKLTENHEEENENYNGSSHQELSFGVLSRKIKLFFLKLSTYHEDFPSFIHIKVKGDISGLHKMPKVELGVALTVFLQEKLTELSYTTTTPHIKVHEVDFNGSNGSATKLAIVDCTFDFDSNDGLLIHPGRTIADVFRRSSGDSLFDPWARALSATEQEFPQAAKKEVEIEDCFAAHQSKPDLYVYTVLLDLFAYIFVLCLYQVAVSSNRSLSESLNESVFPADYIMTMLVLFLFLVADRAVYIVASNKARAFLHFFSVPGYFAGGMVMYWKRAPDHPSYTCIFMFAKCISLAMSSWQLQTGFIKNTSGNLLLRHYNTASWLGVTIYTAIPFLYELRCLLDWTCTATTLTLFDWLTFEEIRLTLFRAKMVKVFKSRRKFGNSQPKPVKFFQGFLFFVLLLIVLWTPLLVFSSGSPSFQVPILKSVNMNVTLLTGDAKVKKPWMRPNQRMPLFAGGNNRKITEAEFSPPLISKYFYYQQLQCLSVAPESNQMWVASEPSKKAFASDLADPSEMAYISVSWSMIRDHPVTASMCASTVYAALDKTTRDALSKALNQSIPVNSTNVKIPLKLLDPVTKQSIPGLYRLYWQLNGSPCRVIDKLAILKGHDPWVDCSLILHTQIDKKTEANSTYAFKSQWWDMECELPEESQNKTDSCWKKSRKSARGKNGPLLKTILQEVQSGVIGTFLSSKGITGLYITFVFLIGRGVRGLVAHRILQIPHMELPCIVKLRTLCDDIRDARTVHDLELEELLYKALIRVYRSSELLYEMTRKLD